MGNIKCPNCGESYYAEKYTTSTAMYSPTIWHEGEVVSSNPNISTTCCECINCHYEFFYQKQYGKIINISLGKKATPTETTAYAPDNYNTNITIDKDYIQLPNTIVCTQEDVREAEIKRLEAEIESLKQQLLEVKANPDWTQRSYL